MAKHINRGASSSTDQKLTLNRQVVLRRAGLLRRRGRGILALQPLGEHVAEERADDGHAPQILQLLGHQRHRLVQTGDQRGGARAQKVRSDSLYIKCLR